MLYRLYAYIYTGIVYPKLKIGFWMLSTGASIPRGNDAFPPVSDSPISENLSDSMKMFSNFTLFLTKFSGFYPSDKISDDLF